MIVVALFLALCFSCRDLLSLSPGTASQQPPLPHQPQHSHKPPSPALKCNHSHVIGNSIKITAPESPSQITGLNWGGGVTVRGS